MIVVDKAKRYFRKSLELPPRMVAIKAYDIIYRSLVNLVERLQDRKRVTYAAEYPKERTFQYFSIPPISYLHPKKSIIRALAEHYLSHRFDLLGSGWVNVSHGIKCRGLEGYRYEMDPAIDPDADGLWLEGRINKTNVVEAKRIWRLIQGDYIPIDWHMDFKSGYRWSERLWYRDVPHGHRPGVDIKVPWELARMQHLPILAWAYLLAKERFRGFKAPKKYALEFRNQILDFMATNPPCFGVNWSCTMDVAIRAANWLAGYDLFRGSDMVFDTEFETLFNRSIYEHGLHITHNLEWHRGQRVNHYLADITGLLFIAAYLPRTPETDAWLAFGVQELIKEVGYQFHGDGSNFEGSTCYHGLAAEMVCYATALALGLPDEKRAALADYQYTLHRVHPRLSPAPFPLYSVSGYIKPIPFPSWFLKRLENMAEFTMHITKPNGHIPQIGDNDSGRFLKLEPCFLEMTVERAMSQFSNLDGYSDFPSTALYLWEELLCHHHIVAAVNGLFERKDFSNFCGEKRLETLVVQELSKGTKLPSYLCQGEITEAEQIVSSISEKAQKYLDMMRPFHFPENTGTICRAEQNLLKGMRRYAYPDFGLYVYCSKVLWLAIRCGPFGREGNATHAHNDQLQVELSIMDVDIISDPGSYIYTPITQRRNEYRSVHAHFAPELNGREPGRLDLGLFQLEDKARAQCIEFSDQRFIGAHWGYGLPVYRYVCIREFEILIADYCEEGDRLIPLTMRDVTDFDPTKGALLFSPGYGIRVGFRA